MSGHIQWNASCSLRIAPRCRARQLRPTIAGVSDSTVPFMSSQALMRLAHDPVPADSCHTCRALVCPGWESLPGSFDRNQLRRVGTLRNGGDEEPPVQEHHPAGTNSWSVDAPIAPAFFPYNRCDVWQCVACGRAFLRYTEFGGYYEDERIRALNPTLVDDAPL